MPGAEMCARHFPLDTRTSYNRTININLSFDMKNLFPVQLAMLAALCMVSASCKRASDGEIRPPAPVTDASAATALGKVVLRWKAPEDPAYQYTRIDYNHPVEGAPVHALVGKNDAAVGADGYATFEITDYEEVSEQRYVLTACGFSEQASEPVTVTVTTQAPPDKPYNLVASSLTVAGDVDGVTVDWSNDMDIPVVVRAQFTGADGEAAVTEVLSSADGGMRIGTIDPAQPQEIKIWVLNRTLTRSSEEKSYATSDLSIAPGAQLPVAGWSLVDSYNAWDANWSAANLIDGDINTAWHTEPSGASPYPYHAAFDMGGDMVISYVDLVPRQQDWQNGPTSVRFELGGDGEEWADAGTFPFDNTTTDTQRFYLKQSAVSARYIRLVLLEGPNPYSMMGEMIPFGAERE